MARDTANTRMRDFHDIHALSLQEKVDINILRMAFSETSRKRGTIELIPDLSEIIERIEADSTMQDQWENYADSSFYAGNLSWKDVMDMIFPHTTDIHSTHSAHVETVVKLSRAEGEESAC